MKKANMVFGHFHDAEKDTQASTEMKSTGKQAYTFPQMLTDCSG
jgi:hypothetical protein